MSTGGYHQGRRCTGHPYRVTALEVFTQPARYFGTQIFLSSHVNTEGGGEASSTAIRAGEEVNCGQKTPRRNH